MGEIVDRLMPENKEAREYLMQASALHDDLRTAALMLRDARSPFDLGSAQDKEWLEQKSAFISGISLEYFSGPKPDFAYTIWCLRNGTDDQLKDIRLAAASFLEAFPCLCNLPR